MHNDDGSRASKKSHRKEATNKKGEMEEGGKSRKLKIHNIHKILSLIYSSWEHSLSAGVEAASSVVVNSEKTL